jgi:LDH2 family malate/lactate/ureidoglycolate dehydrogenase
MTTHAIGQVKSLLEKAAARFVNEREAGLFADLYLETHLRKHPRMNPLAEALADLRVWQGHPDRSFSAVRDSKGVLVLDMNGLAPSLRIGYIHDELETRAREFGLAAVGLKNTSGIITLNLWADGLARRDLIGLAMFNGGTECCVPFGARQGVLGTNPLAYAVPTLDTPVLLDMATTEIPFFDLKNARASGTALKPGTAVDRQGLPTTDAAKALADTGVANLLPMGGGAKGYGIVMLVEILTGALVQSLLSTSQTRGWHPEEYGCLILALDIAAFTDLSTFKKEMSAMCGRIRDLEPAEGSERVTIPGDRGHAALKAALQRGSLDLEGSLVEALRDLAG